MKKIFYILLFIVVIIGLTSEGYCQNINLNNYSSETFPVFTKALGTLLGTGLFHTGSVHASGGFDAGIKSNMIFISEENRTGPLSSIKFIPLPLFQANFGVLDNLELGGRYMNVEFGDDEPTTVSMYSGIVKYGVFQTFGLPKISLSGAYSTITGIDDFSFSALSFSGIVSKGFLLIDFYGGVSYNIYKMEAEFASGGLYDQDFSKSYKETDSRYTLGINLGLIPFTKVNLEYSSGFFRSITVGVLLSIR